MNVYLLIYPPRAWGSRVSCLARNDRFGEHAHTEYQISNWSFRASQARLIQE